MLPGSVNSPAMEGAAGAGRGRGGEAGGVAAGRNCQNCPRLTKVMCFVFGSTQAASR